MFEALRNTAFQLQQTFYSNESGTDAASGVAVTVTRDNGSVLITGAATPAGSGAYVYTLDPQANLDVLTIEWEGIFDSETQKLVTECEIVDSHYLTLNEIRALDSLSNTTKYPLANVILARRHCERLFERYCRRAFVPRYARMVLDGNGTESLWLPHRDLISLTEVTEDGSTVDTSGWFVYPAGEVVRDTGVFSTTARRNVEICYEHGLKYVPQDIKGAAAVFIRYLLLEAYNKTPDRALTVNVDGTLIQMAQAGANRATGLPEVDAVLNDYRSPKASYLGGFSR